MEYFESYDFKRIALNKFSSNEACYKRYELLLCDFSLINWLLKRAAFICLISAFTIWIQVT